jgi:hypothetical protein
VVSEQRNSDPAVESMKNAEDEKWKDKLLPLIDHVHDMKFHSINQIYSPMIKISAPKLLNAYLHEELLHVTNDKSLWHKILNNLHLGVREELNLGRNFANPANSDDFGKFVVEEIRDGAVS